MNKKKRTVKDQDKERKRRLYRRIFFVKCFFVMGLVFLTGRIMFFKLVKGESYEKEVLSRMSGTEKEIEALRGTIVDRNNKTIAASTLVYHIILDPQVLLEIPQDERQKTYKALSEYTTKPIPEIEALVNKNPTSRYKIFQKNINVEEMQMLKEKELGGIWFEESFIRTYPREEFAAQVLGFYNGSTGQYGVEQAYDSYMKGRPGRVFPKVQEGNMITTDVIPAENGDTIILTIDEVIQQYVEQTMMKYIKALKPLNASAIAMNPKTGEVYAMFSYPNFNPNTYSNLQKQMGSSEWNKLSGEQQTAMMNRAWKNYNTQNPYEPGSTFKPLMVSSAIEEGLLDPKILYNCVGSKTVADTTIKCWKLEGHGIQTWEQVLAHSCNPGIIEISQKIPSDIFYKYMKIYGFGEATQIDLPGEEPGLVYDVNKAGSVDKATNAMGQNFTATPIQMITAFSSILNGGYLMKPYVVSQIVDKEQNIVKENTSTVVRQTLSNTTAKQMTQVLEKVILQGTGVNASIPGYRIGGKTGTAEKQPRKEGKHIYSFIGYAPIEDPQIVLLTLFDEVDETAGAPIKAFKEIMENVLPYMEIETDMSIETPVIDMAVVPDLTNTTIYKANDLLVGEVLRYKTIGVGVQVVDQYPQPGTKLPKNAEVKIYLETKKPDTIETVPDLIGKTVGEAKILLGDKFTLNAQNAESIIKHQVPSAGVKIEKGNQIIVQTIQ